MQNKPMLNIKEAADFLGVKAVTLRKWDREGKLKAIRIGSRQDRRYPIKVLSDFLNNFDKTKNIKWQEYLRGKIAINVIMPIIEGPTKRLGKYWGVNYRSHLSYGNEHFCHWCCDRDDNIRVGEAVLKVFSKKLQAEKIKQIWFKMLEEMRELSDKVYKLKNLSEFSDNKLVAIYKGVVEASAEYEGIAFSIDGLDEVCPNKISVELRNVLSRDGHQDISFNKAFDLFTSPSTLSVVAKRDWEVAKIVRQFKNNSITKKIADKKLSELTLLTWWQDLGWDVYEADTRGVLRNIFDELYNNKLLGVKINNWEQYPVDIEKQKADISGKLRLNGDAGFCKVAKIVDEFVVLHDWRKEFQMRELYVQMKVLKEMAKRRAVPFAVLEWATPDEAERIFAGEELGLPEIYQRARGFAILIKDDKTEFLVGDDAEKTWQREREKFKNEILNLGGISASRGKAVGTVFVAFSAGEAMKIPQGYILVTGMTTPEFVPAMRRATAIVTDEGGLTCHAAIISRELGKPCIVGTKYATRVLKTGQTVEVAANHGVVNIISK